MQTVTSLLLLLGTVAGAWAALPPVPSDCDGTYNKFPIYDTAPELVATVPNGKRFVTGPTDWPARIAVLHLSGTPYEMGKAYGQLMKDEVYEVATETYQYLLDTVEQAYPKVPKDVVEPIFNEGAAAALDLTYDLTIKHTPEFYVDLAKGLADGSQFNFTWGNLTAWEALYRISLYPEVTKAACSILHGYGDKAQANYDGKLVTLRALDFATDGPFQKYPLLTVYNPTDGYNHATWGFAGLLGALTGMSEVGIGITEKVWLHYNGKDSRDGFPWTFVLQDVLRRAADTDQALSIIATANRTCSIFSGIGDRNNNEGKILQYAHQSLDIFNDRNFPAYPPYHNLHEGVVFVDKHAQPSHHMCLEELVSAFYGNYTPESVVQIAAIEATGDTHAAVYDYSNDRMIVTVASPYVDGKFDPAYARQWTSVKLSPFWGNVTAGTSD